MFKMNHYKLTQPDKGYSEWTNFFLENGEYYTDTRNNAKYWHWKGTYPAGNCWKNIKTIAFYVAYLQ